MEIVENALTASHVRTLRNGCEKKVGTYVPTRTKERVRRIDRQADR